MSQLKDSVTEIASKRLTAMGIALPDDLSTYVEEVEFAITSYCNLNQVPYELKFVWVNMLLDYVKYVEQQRPSNANGSQKESNVPTMLTSLREGDVTLGFSADKSSQEYQALNAHNLLEILDKFVLNYADSLNRFRRVVW